MRWRRAPLQHPLARSSRIRSSLCAPHSPRPASVTTTSWCAASLSISAQNIRRLLVSNNCTAILISSDGWRTCAARLRLWSRQPASDASLLCAPSSMNWLAPAISLNWLTCCCARIFRARLTLCHGRSPPSRINSSSRSSCVATILAEMSSSCSVRPACVSANVSTCPMTACAPQAPTNRPSMFPSANSRPSAWYPSTPSAVISSSGCASSAPWILCPPMAGFWRALEAKWLCLVPLRDYLHQVCHSLGLSTRIVPHQFRHTYATEMLR